MPEYKPNGNGNGNGVTWKWLVSICFSILMLAGGGWMAFVQGQITDVKKDNEKRNETQATQTADIAVIKEQIKQLNEKGQRQEDNQKDMNRKLDELLRRRQQ